MRTNFQHRSYHSRILALLKYFRKHWFFYLLTFPGIVMIIVFYYSPMYGLLIVFKNYKFSKGILGSPWVGFDNFRVIFQEKEFYKVLLNTIYINLVNITFGFAFVIFLALMINEVKVGWIRRTIQTAVYLPHFISWVVYAGLVTLFLSPSDGVINKIIQAFGGEPVYFLISNQHFRWIIVISSLLKNAGYSTIIYLAALTGVNPELYECAIIDGAHRGHLLWYISLPRIKPTIAVLAIMNTTSLFSSNFEQVFNLYSPVVYETGDVLSTYIYRTGIMEGMFEQAAALGTIFSIIGLINIIITNKFVKKMDVTGIF
ncbi:MAG TPA: ABC transporter permease subunit [Clostridiales bacterium]|nr:ABC transporter permease subunit [Clostridiales bacterium]